MPGSILLVEDDSAIATVITAALEDEGFAIRHCTKIAERDMHLENNTFDAMLTDVMLEDGDGLQSLSNVRSLAPDMPVIVLSAQNTLDTAVRASDNNAFEYFPKPFDLDELVRAVAQATASRQEHSVELSMSEAGDGMPLVGRSPAMQGVYRMITRVLRNDLTVLVTGESGTGKELVAEAVHQLGSRRTGPFVAVNTAAIPHDLVESELFGHEKGAFTGAVPPEAQTRLLRALQSGRIRRVGGRQEIAVDVRIIAATNRDLMPLIEAGKFREDLFYRLNVVPIELPPLRERREDIEVLSQHFLAQAVDEGLPQRQLTKEAVAGLEARHWRGNVRELRNAIYRLAVMSRKDAIDMEVVVDTLGEERPFMLGADDDDDPGAGIGAALDQWLLAQDPPAGTVYGSALAAFEKPLIEHALRQTGGNQLRAAKLLGINRNTLRKRITELLIEPDRYARPL